MFSTDKIRLSDYTNSFITIESHTVGEPTRVVLSGFPEPEGDTMIARKEFYEKNYDHYRQALMAEPRGHNDMVGALLLPPIHDEADLGVIYMDTNRWINMCGHATIGTATVAVNAGLIPVQEPVTHVVLDAPAGLVHADVHVKNGRAYEVSFENIPSFLYAKDCSITMDDGMPVPFAVAYSGAFFALVDVTALGLEIHDKAVAGLRTLGMKILKRINETMDVHHPELNISGVANIEFYGPPKTPEADQCNVVISEEGQVDRSPCGTGTSAKLAYMYSTGRLKMGEQFVNGNFTGAIFKGHVKEEAMVGDYPAIITVITGSAYISGIATYLIDPTDPLKWGFVI